MLRLMLSHSPPRIQQLVNLRTFRLRCRAANSEAYDFRVTETDLAAHARPRLDAFLAAKLPQTSRARLQASIKEGLVQVNGRIQPKTSHQLRSGDAVCCSVLEPPPLEASPEAIPLDVVFEDDHLIVINKSADMVMHPSPGHYSGTLVNALLHRCGLPAVRVDTERLDANVGSIEGSLQSVGAVEGDTSSIHDSTRISTRNEEELEELCTDDDDDDDDDDVAPPRLFTSDASSAAIEQSNTLSSRTSSSTVIRPGIVHRLDKGTTGLVVVAKTDAAHACLSRQFKDRSISRKYISITLGIPKTPMARLTTNIGRDLRDRKRMAAFAYGSARGRMSASNYTVLEELAGGRAALVEWKLETGRTHQIRVHAKHLGHPLLGDETYGGAGGSAAGALGGGSSASRAALSRAVVQRLGRPALHAKSLGFEHPKGGWLEFEADLPQDFEAALEGLRTQF